MRSSILVIVPFLTAIKAANDWTKPCIYGSCSYDLPASSNSSSSGTMTIWGSDSAITDITTAADWQILDCDPNALAQNIRLVCMKDDPSSKCSNLYQSIGAVGKVVRLPENCGGSAFARIAKAWVPDDQSIPASVARRLVRRDGTQPQVKALALDTNFDAADPKQGGGVNIAIQGANVPGAAGSIQIPPSRRNTRLSQRGLGSFVKGAISSITSNSINLDKSITLPPLNLNKNINLLNQKINCGPVTASVNMNLDAKAKALATIGVAATGTLIPPKLTDFGVVAGLNANLDGTFTMHADASGSLDSGKIQLINLGIPGLNFPGILTVGPSFTVTGQVTGNVDLNLDMTVGVNFDVKNATLKFPSDGKQAAGQFNLGDTRTAHAGCEPRRHRHGDITAHLIPSINLGVSALGGKAKAQIFLDLDASATMQLSLEGTADAGTTLLTGKKTSTKKAAAKAKVTQLTTNAKATHTSKALMHTASAKKSMMHANKASATPKAMSHTTTASKAMMTPKAEMVDSRAVTSSFGGCFEIDAGSIFFGLFDANKQVTLFQKNFQLFQKCFGSSAPTKRSAQLLSRLERSLQGRALPASLVKPTTIKAASAKAKKA
ncbi:hypothetical protein B0H10DRAFT_2131051 [Mycena sp. CBHHK59/15]|nr:hypothetical protein B0H10DRAFT_2131051 [Mycena sp. CBHHK59/15]